MVLFLLFKHHRRAFGTLFQAVLGISKSAGKIKIVEHETFTRIVPQIDRVLSSERFGDDTPAFCFPVLSIPFFKVFP
jgi:hypothetical protein